MIHIFLILNIFSFIGKDGTRGRNICNEVPKLQVFIIGVNKFRYISNNTSISGALNNENLNLEIRKTATSVRDYFDAFGEENVQTHLMIDSIETTESALGEFFDSTFKENADNTISLLFFITHGIQSSNQNLRLLTSDYSHYDGFITSNRILESINSLSSNSLVFTFIDACFSGAIKNDADLQKMVTDRNKAGLKSYIVTSATENEKAFNCYFTKALLKVFSDQNSINCITPSDLGDKIYDVYDQMNLTKDARSHVELHTCFGNDKLCLDNFTKFNSLLVIINPEKSVIDFSISSSNSSYPGFKGEILPYGKRFVRLEEGDYKIVFTEKSAFKSSSDIYFNSNRKFGLVGTSNLDGISQILSELDEIREFAWAMNIDDDIAIASISDYLNLNEIEAELKDSVIAFYEFEDNFNEYEYVFEPNTAIGWNYDHLWTEENSGNVSLKLACLKAKDLLLDGRGFEAYEHYSMILDSIDQRKEKAEVLSEVYLDAVSNYMIRRDSKSRKMIKSKYAALRKDINEYSALRQEFNSDKLDSLLLKIIMPNYFENYK